MKKGVFLVCAVLCLFGFSSCRSESALDGKWDRGGDVFLFENGFLVYEGEKFPFLYDGNHLRVRRDGEETHFTVSFSEDGKVLFLSGLPFYRCGS